ncbi:YdeI/OmpD-associated family protein [Nocardia sp. NPDC004654]|uniref:YdeI/OmpD-associated family protein n=1 Tax=Nocardia sp. NPDC004654 TaxID=3154776 RepID=UPI0033AC0742
MPRHAEGDPRAARQGARDAVSVTVRRDTERTVEVPEDLAAALAAAGARPASCSRRRQLVGAIESAKRPETRAKRIDAAVAAAG